MSRTFQDLKAPKISYKAPLLAHTLRMRKIFAIRHGKWYGRYADTQKELVLSLCGSYPPQLTRLALIILGGVFEA